MSSEGKHVFGGILAGVASRMVVAPIDLVKIRLQMETATDPLHRFSPQGILALTRLIYRQEGLAAFWKGNTAGLVLYATFSGIQFGAYDGIRRQFGLGPGTAGGLAALLATLVTYPTDLLRTRMALRSGTSRQYGNLAIAIKQIGREEGLRGFFRGAAPSMAQVIPYMGLTFELQHLVHRLADRKRGAFGTAVTDFVAGAVAGAASKTIIMPVDVIRRRQQIQGSKYSAYAMKDLPVYTGLTNCIRSIWRQEGFLAFYRGLPLALIKSGPASAVSFLVYGLVTRGL